MPFGTICRAHFLAAWVVSSATLLLFARMPTAGGAVSLVPERGFPSLDCYKVEPTFFKNSNPNAGHARAYLNTPKKSWNSVPDGDFVDMMREKLEPWQGWPHFDESRLISWFLSRCDRVLYVRETQEALETTVSQDLDFCRANGYPIRAIERAWRKIQKHPAAQSFALGRLKLWAQESGSTAGKSS
eukprot:TRINITY_DN20559_c0_g1_i1.p1 TRINITY_DN20559_c0_g1~~TRINITY_DN20559_c0_g1_i1.p1  ORF type:complete len:186 (+),score=22.11 TRINITY_DN20559_c0_g1_i1:42-599(+)